jgi:high-affinity Fe2+/Pb2+ permease
MPDNENKADRKTLAIVGFAFGVLTVIVIYLLIR